MISSDIFSTFNSVLTHIILNYCNNPLCLSYNRCPIVIKIQSIHLGCHWFTQSQEDYRPDTLYCLKCLFTDLSYYHCVVNNMNKCCKQNTLTACMYLNFSVTLNDHFLLCTNVCPDSMSSTNFQIR